MSEVTHYLCIGCPLGCRLEVEEGEGDAVEVRGFLCRKGKDFAVQEHKDPRRMVATTVRVDGGIWPRLPVRTKEPIPKAQVMALCRTLHGLWLEAPVNIGDVVLNNALDTGVDVIATRDLPLKSPLDETESRRA